MMRKVKQKWQTESVSGEQLDRDWEKYTAALGGEARHAKALSRREQQIRDFREQGWLVEAIAQQLGISPRTVHVHLANIRRKIGPPTVYWRYEAAKSEGGW